jgi:hypothetical protein
MLKKLGVESNSIRPWPNIILDDPYLALLGQNRTSAPGTPPQTAPDYVLNPLSIFRMARNDIPERHAPENTISPSPHTPAQKSTSSIDDVPDPSSIVGNPTECNEVYATAEGFGPNLDMFFMSNLSWDWQPAETVVGSGIEGEGLLPWVESSQIGGYGFMPPKS